MRERGCSSFRGRILSWWLSVSRTFVKIVIATTTMAVCWQVFRWWFDHNCTKIIPTLNYFPTAFQTDLFFKNQQPHLRRCNDIMETSIGRKKKLKWHQQNTSLRHALPLSFVCFFFPPRCSRIRRCFLCLCNRAAEWQSWIQLRFASASGAYAFVCGLRSKFWLETVSEKNTHTIQERIKNINLCEKTGRGKLKFKECSPRLPSHYDRHQHWALKTTRMPEQENRLEHQSWSVCMIGTPCSG